VSAAPATAVTEASPQPAAAGKWPGVDEAVVARVAAEAGRRPWHAPFAPEGDALLFCFLVAGIAGGFVLGYGWRALFHDSKGARPERPR
jgi:hypothetical protein